MGKYVHVDARARKLSFIQTLSSKKALGGFA
jgi:hypothetical protein